VTEDRRFSEHDLIKFAATCFRAYDVTAHDANIAAEALVAADLRGVHTHGLLLLARYCTQLRQGGVVARPDFRVVREASATALVDGGAGLAQVTAVKAMRMALDKAAAHGVGMVSVRNSHHFGAAAHYATLALERGMIGFASTNAGVTMTAPGAAGRLIGNNPFAFAVPAAEQPFVLDMAMSQSSGGRIRRMVDTGESMPLGWVVDEHGSDTTDPADYGAGGALLPIGGHKGFGLALMIEILSAVLAGAATTTDVRIDTLEPDVPAGMGHLLLAIDIAAFRSLSEFGRDLQHLLGKVASPVTRARVPGAASHANASLARQAGVPLPSDVLAVITRLADDLAVDLPAAL
jgi:LDH2 family malate/lactate/ureidoglycolate dehydrogenase